MNKRLSLKKETLRSLDASELQEANGGTIYFNRVSPVAAGFVRGPAPPPPPIHESYQYLFGG
jgi:hypothetical protein